LKAVYRKNHAFRKSFIHALSGDKTDGYLIIKNSSCHNHLMHEQLAFKMHIFYKPFERTCRTRWT